MTDKKTIEDAVFTTRFARHYEELKSIYSRFYGEESPYFDELCGQMEKWASERSEDLKKLDREREASPDWYKDQNLLGMMMYTEQFADNLKGVKEHLDYVESCGVNYLHLMPLFDSPEGRSDGGYAVADCRKVRPDLGTMADLAKLADLCHEKGMDVIRIDAVPYIWKELGTNCRNLPQVHTIVRMMRMIPYCRPVGFTGQSERVGKKSRCRNCSILCW